MVQSCTEDILKGLIEFTGQVYTKHIQEGVPNHLRFYKPNNLIFSNLRKLYFSGTLQWWKCIGFLFLEYVCPQHAMQYRWERIIACTNTVSWLRWVHKTVSISKRSLLKFRCGFATMLSYLSQWQRQVQTVFFIILFTEKILTFQFDFVWRQSQTLKLCQRREKKSPFL